MEQPVLTPERGRSRSGRGAVPVAGHQLADPRRLPHLATGLELLDVGLDVEHRGAVDGVEAPDAHRQTFDAEQATGADPQEVSAKSDLELLKGYFRVNDFL